MFGYMTPVQDIMDEPVRALYKAYYCGVCKQMGMISRFALSHDCTFLALALASVTQPEQGDKGRCAVKPYKSCMLVRDENTAYAADVNTLLVYHKVLDDIHDDGGLKAIGLRLVQAVLYPAYRAAKRRHPQVEARVRNSLAELSALEAQGCASSDQMADGFARLLQGVAAPGGDTYGPLGRLFYNIGRWIYLIDAMNDYADDVKKGKYNVLALEWPDEQAAMDAMEFALWHTLSEAERALMELGEASILAPVLDHIMRVVLPARTAALYAKEDMQPESV